MTELPFIKMHGLGNDFVVVDGRTHSIRLTGDQIRWIGDRHRGVGFDQLVLVETDPNCDARISFFNADGSAAGACGNATRCIAAWLAKDSQRDAVTLASVAGPLPGRLLPDGRVEVAMPAPKMAWQDIPVAKPCDTLHLPLVRSDLPAPVGVSMGNPHAVFFLDDVDSVERLGPMLETDPLFPERANIGFARVESPEQVRLRVFERGAGMTLACGSGACAALVAAVRRGLNGGRAAIEMDGGTLEIAWPGEGPVLMTGPVARSFVGQINLLDAAA